MCISVDAVIIEAVLHHVLILMYTKYLKVYVRVHAASRIYLCWYVKVVTQDIDSKRLP